MQSAQSLLLDKLVCTYCGFAWAGLHAEASDCGINVTNAVANVKFVCRSLNRRFITFFNLYVRIRIFFEK